MRQRFVPAPTAERQRRLVVVAALAGAGLTLAAGGAFAAYAVTRDDPDAVGAARSTTAMQTSVPAAPVGLVSTLANAGTTTAAKRTSTPGTTAATSAPVAHRPTTTAVAAPTTTRRAPPPPAVAAKTRRTTTMTTTAPRTTRTTTTTTTTPTTTAPAAPSSYAIADDFADDFRDGTIWHQIVTGTSVDIRPSGGQLVVSIGADAVPGGPYDVIEGHYGTQCSFPGDFDARVDFELLDWPDGGGVSVGLWAFFANAAVVRKNTTRWGDLYAGWVVPSNGDTSLPDRRGSLRVARVDGTITTFFWHDGSWRTLASGRDRGTAVLGPTAQATRNEFGHEAVRVAFDNFEVDAGEVSCPAGSQPPARG